MFDAVAKSNPGLALVREGGDREVLLGLDRDNVRCVEPTGYCEFRVALRVRDAQGRVLHAEVRAIGASGESCSNLCEQALMKAATYAVEQAAKTWPTAKEQPHRGSPPHELTQTRRSSTPPIRMERRRRRLPVICGIGAGARLPSDEAERRIAQVDALKRQDVLDAQESECLRKAFLARL